MNSILLRMAKGLDEYGLRAYSKYICIKDNEATITNGFALMQWTPKNTRLGNDRILSSFLTEVEYTYPKYESVIPKYEATHTIDSEHYEHFYNSLKAFRNTTTAQHVWLKIDNSARNAGPFFVPSCKQKSTAFSQLPTFNMGLLMGYFKTLDAKNTTIQKMYCDGKTLQIVFDTKGETFKILLVSIDCEKIRKEG